MEEYTIFDNKKLYSQLGLKIEDKILFFGIYPKTESIKADNKNKNIIIELSDGK